MNVAIIGAGFTGLSAAYSLTKKGHTVSLFEKEKSLGGLAGSFRLPGWKWSVEQHYHHWFTNDSSALGLIKELGLEEKLLFPRTRTSVYYQQKIYPFNGPKHILTFSPLPISDRIRVGAVTAYLKLLPKNQAIHLEKYKAVEWLRKYYGKKAYSIIWEPLLKGKFGSCADKVNMAWFWARIKKRTFLLGYLEGGYQVLVDALSRQIQENGGKIYTETLFDPDGTDKYDSVIVTTPSVVFVKMFTDVARKVKQARKDQFSRPEFNAKMADVQKSRYLAHEKDNLPGRDVSGKFDPEGLHNWEQYSKRLLSIPHLNALNLLLITKEKILDKEYWLNINDRSFPFIGVIQQTNMIDPKYYGDNHLTWVANYLPSDHPYLKMSAKELFHLYLPYLQKINPSFNFKLKIENCKLFIGPFAQPVFPLNYSRIKPGFDTPIPHVYLANMDMVYPWDRGTNYAIEMGKEIAGYVTKISKNKDQKSNTHSK